VEFTLKSVSNDGHFTLGAEAVVSPYLPSHRRGVNEILHMELRAHALPAVEVRLKWIRIEGHFILEALTFSSYRSLYLCGVTEICHMPLPADALQGVHFVC
jgi:hypothetical protein